ncbi:MAG: CPBP family intramembrane metalloprotease [Victivallales bacterium]|nr:CPBP family intramembrane metalloprotease [Victivallales bacterium]
MTPSPEEHPIDEATAQSSLLQKCDMLAIKAAFLGFLLQLAGSSFANSLKNPFLAYVIIPCQGICSIFILLAGYFIGHRATAVPWSQLIPRATTRPLSRLVFIISFAIASFILVTTFNLMVVYIFRINPGHQSQFLIDAFKNGGWAIRLILLVEVCLAAPVFEELAFRLAIPRWLSSKGFSGFCSSLITSLLFGLFHFIWWGIPGLFLFSMILCHVRQQQDIFSCFAVHSLYNFLIAVTATMTT